MTKAWTDAAGDGNGKLNLQQYKNFDEALRKIATDANEWYDEDKTDVHYEVLNQMSEGDGFSMTDMMKTWGPWMAKFEELKAAEGL